MLQEKLISSGLAEWQGPALLIYNSGVFSEADLDCFMQRVGDSAKDVDSRMIGQFGLGAITAYHFADFIQLLSGLPTPVTITMQAMQHSKSVSLSSTCSLKVHLPITRLERLRKIWEGIVLHICTCKRSSQATPTCSHR